jgi:hypothetical protein
MTETRQTTTAMETAEGNSVYGECIIEPHKKTKHFLRDCPCKSLRSVNNCAKIPDDWICGSDQCWRFAKRLITLDFTKFDEEDLKIFHDALISLGEKTANRLIDEYLEKAGATD